MFLEAGSFEPLREEYVRGWLHSGQIVSIDLGRTPETVNAAVAAARSKRGGGDGGGVQRDAAATGVSCAEARIVGLSSASACLLAEVVGTGQRVELLPDGNRLDFFKGMITRKLPG